MTTNDFIQQCKNSGKFDAWQIAQICHGFVEGLTINQVKLFADFKFSWEQMWEIRKGFENGLTMKQVKLYAKPEFNDEQMEKIREFIKENNITNISINTIKFLIGLDCI